MERTTISDGFYCRSGLTTDSGDTACEDLQVLEYVPSLQKALFDVRFLNNEDS